MVSFQQAAGLIDFERETSARLQRRVDLDAKAEDIRIQLDGLDLQVSHLTKEISEQNPALVSIREALEQARSRYTEEHPRIKALRAALASIEARGAAHEPQIDLSLAASSNSLAGALSLELIEARTRKSVLGQQLEAIGALRDGLTGKLQALAEKRLDYARLESHFQSLKASRDLLSRRLGEAQLLANHPAGDYRILEPAQVQDISPLHRLTAATGFAIGFGLLGMLAATLTVLWLELCDGRIRTAEDLKRVTKLPILATLGDLADMNEQEKEAWAFRTLAAFKGRLNHSPNEALVCGIISSTHGEGRSTWVNLLAQAARKWGQPVLTISTSAAQPGAQDGAGKTEEARSRPGYKALTAPSDVTMELMAASPHADLHLAFPDTVRSPAWREQWRDAFQQWNQHEKLIVFAELPPASVEEGILLSENLSKVVWLAGKDMPTVTDTRSQLETLKHCRCEVVGAVFNQARTPAWRSRLAHLTGALTLALALLATSLPAQPTNPPAATSAPPTNRPSGSLSVSSPDRLAAWQKRLTLGPSDLLDISLYEQTDSLRIGLSVGPDGRLSYMQARDVMAAGLTVDELRAKLEDVLAKFHLSPRVVIIPTAYNSKRYYVLGNVVQKGVFLLDRPLTIIEAIAKAKGFSTFIQARSTLVLSDLSRSFLIRKEADGAFKRVDVNFEALFLRGDLTQNLALAPDDYLYFPPLDLPEIYVLGEVRTPGPLTFTPEMSALRAIVARGGFTEKAWRRKVLIIRGSLTQPKTFVVNAPEVLRAQTPDFQLEARDIVFVSRKPWAKAEEILEGAMSDFIRAMVIIWTGHNVGPIITQPFVPNIK
jgi:protein involved in polysaccharide export with SLBB domain